MLEKRLRLLKLGGSSFIFSRGSRGKVKGVNIRFGGGIWVEGLEFALDSLHDDLFSYVSHPHYDSTASHKKIIASPQTARLYAARFGPVEAITVRFGEELRVGSFSVKLLPSGHMLGSSQILIENDLRICYTGHFRMVRAEAAQKTVVEPCDILIMECTYGHPSHVFPDRREIVGMMVEFVERCLEEEVLPVLYAYSLGKAQEVVKILGGKGFRLVVHPSIYEMCKIYEELGVDLKNYEKYERQSLRDRVLVVPPFSDRTAGYEGISLKRRTALLTGWALNRECRAKFGVDEAIPLSDHADFTELLSYVDLAQPKKIYCLYGCPDFVSHLLKKGYDAIYVPPLEPQEFWEDL